MIYDREHSGGEISLHFSSAFDPILNKWGPVLMSIMFGRSANDYRDHYTELLQSYEATNWKQFDESFPGMTVDWSEGERKGYVDAFVNHVRTSFEKWDFNNNDANTYLRKCDVHFKRSRQRIIQNNGLVPVKKEKEFKDLTDTLISGDTEPSDFKKAVRALQKKFQKTMPWLIWHLNPIRAKSYFPACVLDKERFKKMSKSTNAQENLGGQFQALFSKKMTLNESLVNSWKFVNRFHLDHQASRKGLSTNYSHYPRICPPMTKRKRHVNDGRGPDTAKKLRSASKKSKKSIDITLTQLFANQGDRKLTRSVKKSNILFNKSEHLKRFRGIQWSFQYGNIHYSNTCPLDSFLVLLYILHKGKVMITPLVETENKQSLLSRAFKELDNDPGATGGINARMLFVKEFYHQEWLKRNNNSLHSSLDIFFNKNDDQDVGASGVSPILSSVTWQYTRDTAFCTLGSKCTSSGGPKISRKSKRIKIMTKISQMNYEPTQAENKQMGVQCLKDIIDAKFCPKLHSNAVCSVEYIPTGEKTPDGIDKKESAQTCVGLLQQPRATIVKFPHLAVIDQGEADMTAVGTRITDLYDLPLQFEHMEKRWILRGVIFGNNLHFTAAARLPFSWMYYDGISDTQNGIKFSMHSLGKNGCKEAMHGYGISQIYYELVELNETRQFGSLSAADESIFEFKGSIDELIKNVSGDSSDDRSHTKDEVTNYQSSSEEENEWSNEVAISDDDLSDDELIEESSNKKIEKNKSVKTKKLVNPVRIPYGWSFRQDGLSKRGPNPKCKGCNGFISKKVRRMHYNHIQKGCRYRDIDQYHCKVSCLKKASRESLKKLIQKHQTEPFARNVVRQLDKEMNISP